MKRLVLLISATCLLACGAGDEKSSATKAEGRVVVEPSKPVIPDPQATPAPDLSPPPAADAPTGVQAAEGDSTKVLWDGDYRVQSMAMDASHIYVSRTAIPGGERGQIARVPIAGGDLEIVVDDLGRPDEIVVDGDEVFWIDRPGRPEDPPTGVRAAPKAGGETRLIATDPRIEHSLTVAPDAVYWVLRVEQQGKVGGFAGAPRSGGEPEDFFLEKGPVFHIRPAAERVVFMAHVGSGPDVIYSAKPDGSGLAELHRAPRGIVALHVADDVVYWAQASFDELETSVMRAPLSGGPAKTLWRLEGKLLDQIATDAQHVWTSTSAVEDVGEVFVVPLGGGDATKVAESRHVWRLFGREGRVAWWDSHYVDGQKRHRVRTKP